MCARVSTTFRSVGHDRLITFVKSNVLFVVVVVRKRVEEADKKKKKEGMARYFKAVRMSSHFKEGGGTQYPLCFVSFSCPSFNQIFGTGSHEECRPVVKYMCTGKQRIMHVFRRESARETTYRHVKWSPCVPVTTYFSST